MRKCEVISSGGCLSEGDSVKEQSEGDQSMRICEVNSSGGCLSEGDSVAEGTSVPINLSQLRRNPQA
ncbi:hypothetical protein [Cohnella herbarum]|uniref:Uncharacterized protein n=1 Tax=Cohnella herbarum TaxID=2728023 RepID=A0A7Z2VLI2_9BACL|nr:hypothetical protein [Cohnella herbarum]QJD85287.1 hypothetical protein HH215_20330 [Cohnella herbarum]